MLNPAASFDAYPAARLAYRMLGSMADAEDACRKRTRAGVGLTVTECQSGER